MRSTDEISMIEWRNMAEVFFCDDIPGGMRLQCQGCFEEFNHEDGKYGDIEYFPSTVRAVLYPSGASW